MSSIPQRLIEQETTVAQAAAAAPVVLKKSSLLGDYLQLFKVRVTSLIVITAWAGYYMGAARSGVSSLSFTLFNALLGIGLTSAGAAALNEAVEHRVDALMARTRNRPLPAGRMRLGEGFAAGALATLAGPLYLSYTTNVLTGVLAFLTASTLIAQGRQGHTAHVERSSGISRQGRSDDHGGVSAWRFGSYSSPQCVCVSLPAGRPRL